MFLAAPISKMGRAVLAMAIKSQTLHLAWGTGNPAWDDMDRETILAEVMPPLAEATALENELGRRVPSLVSFVEPDENGGITVPVSEIEIPGQDGAEPTIEVEYARYRQVDGPSPYLYFSVKFDYADANAATIREMALFMGTVAKPEIPPGQLYLKPGELEFSGYHIATQIVQPAIARSSSVRPNAEWVLPI